MTETDRRCLSVVVPAYNEAATIEHVVQRLLALSEVLEIIIVDDCSSDRTPEILQRLVQHYPAVKSVRHEKNSGKTEARKSGFALTRGEIVIVQDADLEYDPRDIPEVIRPIIEGSADVVFGSRFLVRRAAR